MKGSVFIILINIPSKDQHHHLQITNIYNFRDAVLIGVANSLTSFYAGFIVFGTLGMLAEVSPKIHIPHIPKIPQRKISI